MATLKIMQIENNKEKGEVIILIQSDPEADSREKTAGYLEPVPKSPILFSPQNQAGAKSRICAA
ncbi:hypothetical protein P4E94_18810 [Pontiellaceae bacterium B12219]|nr:hypothetical protein [Pontiellaceae bacterium B12219]